MKMIRNKEELSAYLESIGYDKSESDYKIAVEALIFTPEGKVILEERGPDAKDEVGKLEGVGGGIGDNDDLHRALQEEIGTELGVLEGGLKVEIERLLEVRQVQFEDELGYLNDWVVVSYLCRQIEGIPVIGEPGKIAALHELTLDEIYAMDEADISKSVVIGRETYRAKYGNRPYYEVPEDTL